LLTHQVIDGLKGLPMRGKHLGEGFPEILQQMKAVGDLGGRGRPLSGPVGIGL
jgi:hypothetical protein